MIMSKHETCRRQQKKRPLVVQNSVFRGDMYILNTRVFESWAYHCSDAIPFSTLRNTKMYLPIEHKSHMSPKTIINNRFRIICIFLTVKCTYGLSNLLMDKPVWLCILIKRDVLLPHLASQ